MKRISATLTQRSQVTVPAEVRRVLGIGPRDKVVFTIEGSEVKITPEPFTLETAFGSVKPMPGTASDFEEQIRLAKEDRAEQLVAKMHAGRS